FGDGSQGASRGIEPVSVSPDVPLQFSSAAAGRAPAITTTSPLAKKSHFMGVRTSKARALVATGFQRAFLVRCCRWSTVSGERLWRLVHGFGN
ncbi:MAG TPA: hypothetical protein VGJ84_10380, partial [Polyangiaceae bacterium]